MWETDPTIYRSGRRRTQTRRAPFGCVTRIKGCSTRGKAVFRVESMLTSKAYPLAPIRRRKPCPLSSPTPPRPPSPRCSCRASGRGSTPPATGSSPCCTGTRSPTRCGRSGSGRWTRCSCPCTAAAPTRWRCWGTWCGSFHRSPPSRSSHSTIPAPSRCCSGSAPRACGRWWTSPPRPAGAGCARWWASRPRARSPGSSSRSSRAWPRRRPTRGCSSRR